jgi:hypothetical protein
VSKIKKELEKTHKNGVEILKKVWMKNLKVNFRQKKPCQKKSDRDKTKNKHYEQTLIFSLNWDWESSCQKDEKVPPKYRRG